MVLSFGSQPKSKPTVTRRRRDAAHGYGTGQHLISTRFEVESSCRPVRQFQLQTYCGVLTTASPEMSRPESTGHASLFYNAKEARKYDSSSRMVGIQREITERAIELLKLPPGPREGGRPSFVLDVGCGSGLSGQVR